MVGFVGEHPRLGAARTFPFLAADFLDAGALGGHIAAFQRFNLVEQEAAGDEAVESLLAGGLTFDLQAGRTVQQHHTGGGLVDVLSTMAAGADKGFFNVSFAHAQRDHALRELGFLFRADRERAHVVRVAGRPFVPQRERRVSFGVRRHVGALKAVTCHRTPSYLTTSNAKPLKYSVSGIIGMMGWSGLCEYVATRRRILRVS